MEISKVKLSRVKNNGQLVIKLFCIDSGVWFILPLWGDGFITPDGYLFYHLFTIIRL